MKIIQSINEDSSDEEFINIINRNIGKKFNTICSFETNGIIKGIIKDNNKVYLALEFKEYKNEHYWTASPSIVQQFKDLPMVEGNAYNFYSKEEILKSL